MAAERGHDLRVVAEPELELQPVEGGEDLGPVGRVEYLAVEPDIVETACHHAHRVDVLALQLEAQRPSQRPTPHRLVGDNSLLEPAGRLVDVDVKLVDRHAIRDAPAGNLTDQLV